MWPIGPILGTGDTARCGASDGAVGAERGGRGAAPERVKGVDFHESESWVEASGVAGPPPGPILCRNVRGGPGNIDKMRVCLPHVLLN